MTAHSIRLRGCPRCCGDLFPEYESPGWSLSCLQCGYTRWLEPVGVPAEEADKVPGALVGATAEKEKIAA